MDCRTARLLLDFARPRSSELPPDDAAALSAHLAGCADCDALANAERAMDAWLGEAMRDVSIPDGLRGRVLARLELNRSEHRRRVAGWTVRVSAAAAVILVAVFGALWYFNRPQTLDLWTLHNQVYAFTYSSDPKKVEGRFKDELNVTTVVPTAFNYAYLKDFGIAPCQGRRVPKLYFAHQDTEAHVYIVTAEQFDLEALSLSESERIDSGGLHVEVRREDPDHAFVVIYRGDSLQPLLAQESTAQ
jgi:hypothetical protein